MKFVYSFTILAFLAACTAKQEAPKEAVETSAKRTLPSNLEQAIVNSPYRSPENQQRDKYRHPMETLNFFGIKPDMTVVEITPGAGWYTEILAPYLTPKGRYIAAAFPAGNSSYLKAILEKYNGWLQAHPEVKVTTTTFALPDQLDIAPEGSADMVLTFRNVHNWMSNGHEDKAFAAFYKALKPGGILGVVEHRANENAKSDPRTGYVKESEIIRIATKAGFMLDAKSEINANPKDSKDYKDGVWTLPPTLRKGDQDREKYLAIGESDRMTLRFIKPKDK